MNDEWSRNAGSEHGSSESGSLVRALQDRVRGVKPSDENLVALIDWFLPQSIVNGCANELRRARLTVAAGFLVSVAVLLTLTATTERVSIPIRTASYSIALIFLLAPFLLKRGLPPNWVQNSFIAVMCIYSIALSVATGGADTGGVLLALVIPLVAILLCGSTVGTWWSLATGVCLGVVGIAIHLGFDPPVKPHAEAVAAWNMWAGGAGILGLLGVALVYEWLRESAVRELEAAHLRADQAHAQQLEIESHFRAQLEQLVEERTQALVDSREQLRRADRLASVGTLAAGVAHQINNPVGAILLSAQFALTSGDDPDREQIYRDALVSSAENAKRCGHIVQNLLRFTRNDSTEKSLLDLSDITRESIGGLHELTNRFGLNLCQDPLPIHASRIEIEQVIVNLARNAIESGHPESRVIEIRTERRGPVAILHVSDHGHGIKEDDRERIFDPFFTTRITHGGTGLGLSLVHGVVEGHGGSIDVHSQPGEGTRFSIHLPIAASPEDTAH